jgi:hypothetical protein
MKHAKNRTPAEDADENQAADQEACNHGPFALGSLHEQGCRSTFSAMDADEHQTEG